MIANAIEYRDQLIREDKNKLFEDYRKAKNRELFIHAWDKAHTESDYNKQEWKKLEDQLRFMGILEL